MSSEGSVGLETAASVFGLIRSIADLIASPQQEELSHTLQSVARLVAKLPGIRGAAVVAFDEECQPLTAGAHGIAWNRTISQLDALFEICRQIDFGDTTCSWTEVAASFFAPSADTRYFAIPVKSSPSAIVSGLLVASLDPSVLDAQDTLFLLAESRSILAAAIQSSLRGEAWSRIERLQQLAQQTFSKKGWDLKELACALAQFFQSEAATILLEEAGELRLAASTDHELESSSVVYKPGEGLTGFVFGSGRPLRIGNTSNAAEIRRLTGIERVGPRHPERDGHGAITDQFLGVAMRYLGTTAGVVRISRCMNSVRFTLEDEKALQFFADLLGATLAPYSSLQFGKSVFESVTEAILVSRRESDRCGGTLPRITQANPGAAEILRRDSRDLVGMDAREIYAPGEYEKVYPALKFALARAQMDWRSEYGPVPARLKRSDGVLIPVSISYRVLAYKLVSPPTVQTIGIIRDLTEVERRAEQNRRFLDLLETMGLAYFQADQNDITREPTAAESRITGYPLEELEGLNRKLLSATSQFRQALLDRARSSGGVLNHAVEQMVKKDGTLIMVEGDLRIIKDPMGNEVGVEGFYRDVTDRIRLQRFLNEDTNRVITDAELFGRLQRNAEAHLDYMSSLGHQLQTPLGSLIETLRNFESGVISQKRLIERLPYTIGQARVCSRLVRNLSYMDTILRGEPFQRERISMAKLAIETKLDFRHLWQEKKLDIFIDDESLDRHLRVSGHQEMLRQVIVNLVDNAIKYSLPGSSIQIRARKWREGPAFEISNAGLSIAPEDSERIFDRGFRTSQAQMWVPHGTGLGLWLVRKIVEAHGASIRCHQVFEGGQERLLFRILFPSSDSSPRRSS